MLLGLYFHLLALCVFVHIPPQPPTVRALPSLPFALLPTLVRESSSNSSFPSTITFLPLVSLSLSFSLARSRHPPFRSLPLNPFLTLRLCLISPFSHHFLLNPRAPSSPILPRASFRRPHLFPRCASPRRVFPVPFPRGSRPALAMGPIQFPSCNFQSIHKRLSSSKAIDRH